MSEEKDDLPTVMVRRADKDQLAQDHPVRVAAAKLAAVIADPNTTVPKLVGTWARTRTVWCEYSGEPLV